MSLQVTLKEVGSAVRKHKLQAEINEAFATFLRDTKISPMDVTEKERILFQLAFVSGYSHALKIAEQMVGDETRRLLSVNHTGV